MGSSKGILWAHGQLAECGCKMREDQETCFVGPEIMDAKHLQIYGRLLLAKRDELSAPRDKATALVPPGRESEGDRMECASADAEAELQVRLHQADGRLLKAIENALARIRAGAFGVCEACQQPISKARLEVVPWTRLCRQCKEREQSAA
jgi:DnaK suppressor protein